MFCHMDTILASLTRLDHERIETRGRRAAGAHSADLPLPASITRGLKLPIRHGAVIPCLCFPYPPRSRED